MEEFCSFSSFVSESTSVLIRAIRFSPSLSGQRRDLRDQLSIESLLTNWRILNPVEFGKIVCKRPAGTYCITLCFLVISTYSLVHIHYQPPNLRKMAQKRNRLRSAANHGVPRGQLAGDAFTGREEGKLAIPG
jgi:hypothetical protein